ncbi:hypothetical protein [Salinimicrobium xinjiangense]|uniref:hypothetical protein n=1 Tax=Salinimicrobium xinjiangense TaxID=438596 RepID=UPI00048AAAE7|nr:hypothetical protein [Salinimicrobium xinjiangense]
MICSCKSSDEEAIAVLGQKFNLEEGFQGDYVIEEITDDSYENSQMRTIKITVPPNLTRERIEKNIQKLILDYLSENGQTKLHIKAYLKGDSIDQYPTVARAEFLPQMGWLADDQEYELKTYNLDIEYRENYFGGNDVNEVEKEIREVELFRDTKWDNVKKEFVKAESVPLSNAIREWTDDKIIVEIPNNSKAKIIDEYSEKLVGGAEIKRYKVEVEYNGKTYQGWIHSEEVK